MTSCKNTLLSLPSAEDWHMLAPHFETVPLRQGTVLHQASEPIEHIYFVEAGFSSEIAFDRSGEKIEVGCIGREGFVGIPAFLGVEASPHKSFMETDGAAKRVRPLELISILQDNGAFKQLLLKFVHVFMMQVAATALADGRYTVDQRAARWLLMSHDRLEGDRLPLTHDFLSLMLGVRRSSVTNALHFLEGELAIKADRAMITVRDRAKLEDLAGGCYGQPETEYRRVLGCNPWPAI